MLISKMLRKRLFIDTPALINSLDCEIQNKHINLSFNFLIMPLNGQVTTDGENGVA